MIGVKTSIRLRMNSRCKGSGHFRVHVMLGMNIKMPATLCTRRPREGAPPGHNTAIRRMPAARRTHAVVCTERVHTAAPEQLQCSGTTPRPGTIRWPHTGGETTPSLQMPRDARPARLSSFRLLAMASPQLDARRKLLI